MNVDAHNFKAIVAHLLIHKHVNKTNKLVLRQCLYMYGS